MKKQRTPNNATRPLRKGESWAKNTGQAPPLGGRPGPGHTKTLCITINGEEHEVPEVFGCPLIDADMANKLSKSTDGYTLLVGGLFFLGEGSGPFEVGEDKNPERRAEVPCGLIVAGFFNTLEEAESAGEDAIGPHGYYGVFGDSYVVPEAAGMRFICTK